MKHYVPQPGSIPEQAIAYLRRNGPTRSTQLGRDLGKRGADLYAFLKAAFGHGAILSAGSAGRVRVLYLPGQDPTATLEASVGITRKTSDPTEGEATMPRDRRATAAPAAPPAEATPAPLTMAVWSDGDLVVRGDALEFVTDDDGEINGVMLRRGQVEQLVRFVVEPMVRLTT